MKNNFILFIFLCLASVNYGFAQNNARVFDRIKANVENEGKAYETLQEATSAIGHRLTGSPNGKKAEEFAFNLLKSYGYGNVKYQAFEVNAWERNQVSLSIVPANSDNFRDVEVVALAHSPVSSHVTAQIVDCGDGLASDFEKVKDSLKGKFALFNINVQSKSNEGQANLHRSEKTSLAIKYGAAGVIIANAVKGGVLLTGTASVTGELIPIPAVCVSIETGKAIRKWIRDETNILAIVDMQNYSRPIKARNVIATYEGKSKKYKGEKIVIGGHLDSWDLADGAVDNGIGSFSVIDIARTFKDLNLKTKRTVEFVLFMGEEQGLLGSKHYVKQSEDMKGVALMINLDMVNDAHGFNAGGDSDFKEWIESVGKEIVAVDANYKNMNSNRAGLHSDHESFMLKGIPTCNPSGRLSIKALNCYHANCDKFELINKSDMTNNVKFTSMMAFALATAKEFPVKTRNDSENQEFLIDQNLKDQLILGQSWPWVESK
ncbi:Zn-dependent amino- or carboxypeptidase, M28 family [Spirosomataceae bacterium TFI 002]|nr:Zn-dependent amino- or carboxypeptidase, M28 family [Spirosomataceae bacterium TFI 002]